MTARPLVHPCTYECEALHDGDPICPIGVCVVDDQKRPIPWIEQIHESTWRRPGADGEEVDREDEGAET